MEAAIAAAWALLLNRITGEEAVMFGVSVRGRTFPLIVETPDELISGVLVRSVESRIARSAVQAAVGYPKIREWSEIKSGARLFESIMAYDGVQVFDPAAVNCPFLVRVSRPAASELRLDLHFEPGLLSGDRALRLTKQLAKLVSALLKDPQCRLGELSVLTDWESNRLLVEWNRTDLPLDEGKCVHQLFAEQALRTPGRTAVVFRDQKLSYEELNQRAERLAAHLQSNLGVGPEAVVAICMEPSLNLTVALLGILKAGGAYLPVDPAFPAERIAFMLRDSKAAVIVTQPGLTGRLREANARMVVLDDGCQFTALAGAVESAVQAENLAYLMFTSGSTGNPKGVMVEHRNVVNFFGAMDQILGTEPGVWLAVTSISFDISVLELLWTLTRGFTVVVQAEEDKLIAQGRHSLAEQLGRHRRHSPAMHPDPGPDARSIAGRLAGDEVCAQAAPGRRAPSADSGATAFQGPERRNPQHVWADRDHSVVNDLPVVRRRAGINSHWQADCQHLDLYNGPASAPGTDRIERRTIYRRQGSGARILEPAGTDRRAIHFQSLQRRSRRPPLPDRRSRPLSRGRSNRVSGEG